MFNVHPFAATATSSRLHWLTKIPALSHEGIRFDKELNLAVGQSFVFRMTGYTGNVTLNWDNSLFSRYV
jgi:hypothetical protein